MAGAMQQLRQCEPCHGVKVKFGWDFEAWGGVCAALKRLSFSQ
jgi:hypothetical protein